MVSTLQLTRTASLTGTPEYTEVRTQKPWNHETHGSKNPKAMEPRNTRNEEPKSYGTTEHTEYTEVRTQDFPCVPCVPWLKDVCSACSVVKRRVFRG